jgi:hypothetical protein
MRVAFLLQVWIASLSKHPDAVVNLNSLGLQQSDTAVTFQRMENRHMNVAQI